MRYVDRDGATFNAGGPEELVRALREASRTPARDDTEFMWQAASRAHMQTGKKIRVGSPAEFVEDLLAAGLLRIDDGEEDEGDGHE